MSQCGTEKKATLTRNTQELDMKKIKRSQSIPTFILR